MNERDELAKVISEALGVVTGIFDTTDAEDSGLAAIILAAGYRKPRQVTTAEELDALPEGTKLYSPNTTHSWELRDFSVHGGVKVTGTGGGYTHLRDFIKYEAPLTVLHIGTTA